MKKTVKHVRLYAALLICLLLAGCSSSSTVRVAREDPSLGGSASQPLGVVEYVWEEPMVDTIEVPPGLDPEGHYYRPAHQAVVEIRQGRWKHYKQP